MLVITKDFVNSLVYSVHNTIFQRSLIRGFVNIVSIQMVSYRQLMTRLNVSCTVSLKNGVLRYYNLHL